MDLRKSLTQIRNSRMPDKHRLNEWFAAFAGFRLSPTAVCDGHHATLDAFAALYFGEPSEMLWLGSRGSGKSFMSGGHAHLRSRHIAGHATRILGGSEAQSRQVYNALKSIVLDGKGKGGSDRETIKHLGVKAASYRNGSEVQILTASPLSVRGPHVPDLKLDEVDEIDPELREAAYGMAMQRRPDVRSTILMTSTWHNVGGPMTELVARSELPQADPKHLPIFRFCLFDVLERCPESRSGPWVGGEAGYLHCPECPLKAHCHADRDSHGGIPRAKRAAGHYTIASAIQKVTGVGDRTFAADYLCSGPRPDGIWFSSFDDGNVSERAVYDPRLPLHAAIDSGVFSGIVYFQAESADGEPAIRVIADELIEGEGAEDVGQRVRERIRSRYRDVVHTISTDPAGDSRNAIGPKVIGLYERAGLKGIKRWPSYPGSVADGLALVESFVRSADGRRSLLIHPSCKRTIEAFRNYRRAKRAGQWQDYPDDPQHPHEDVLDALRGGLMVAFPQGRKPEANFGKAPISRRI